MWYLITESKVVVSYIFQTSCLQGNLFLPDRLEGLEKWKDGNMMKSHPGMSGPLVDGSIPTRIKQFIEINVTDPQVCLRISVALQTSCKHCTVSPSNTSIQ